MGSNKRMPRESGKRKKGEENNEKIDGKRIKTEQLPDQEELNENDDDHLVENNGNHNNEVEEQEEEVGQEDGVFEAGMILKVHMENFMCHTKFTVTLGRMLNFITGANGSG